MAYIRFRLFRVRSPLLSESLVYFLFVLLLRCFSSQTFLYPNYVFIWKLWGMSLTGFPHSEFHGSRGFSASPWLIAALHVLHRLSVPRHPPLALCSFTCYVIKNHIFHWFDTCINKFCIQCLYSMQFSMYSFNVLEHWKQNNDLAEPHSFAEYFHTSHNPNNKYLLILCLDLHRK